MMSMMYQFHHDPSILSYSNRPVASLAFCCSFGTKKSEDENNKQKNENCLRKNQKKVVPKST